jgi:hypothetical protein
MALRHATASVGHPSRHDTKEEWVMTGGKTSKREATDGLVKKASKGRPEFEVTLVGGDQYESLEAAQQAALGPLADALAAGIRSALAAGALIIVDGVVTLPPDEDEEEPLARRAAR